MTPPAPLEQSAAPSRRSWRFLGRPGWIAGILGAVTFAVLCWTVLAPWQFGRHSERAEQNARVLASATATPVPVTQVLPTDRPMDPASTWQPVTATGTFEPDAQVYVRLRQDAAGMPASEVVVPLRLDDGSVLLVDRGYVPFAELSAGVPVPPVPAGRVTVTGRVQPFQPDPLGRAPSVAADGRIDVIGIDPVAIPGLTGQVRQGFVQLDETSPGVLTAIGLPQTDAGPFFSYAVQWCIFGAVALLGMAFFVVREYRDPVGRGDETEGRPEDPTAAQSEDDGAPGVDAVAGRARSGRSTFDPGRLYDPQ